MGKKSSSVQADAAVFSQLREENAVQKQENEELRSKLSDNPHFVNSYIT